MGNFVSKQAADHFSFALQHVSNIPIVFTNGTTGACNKAASATYLRFENHEEHIDLRVVSLPNHDVILGKPWLEKWNPSINWQTHQITFKPITDIPLLVKKLQPRAILPERKTPLSAGYDLTPTTAFTLAPGTQQLLNLELSLAIPEGSYGQLHIRSSLAKQGLTVLAGVIDADYRGLVGIIIQNLGTEPFTFAPGDPPVAQIVLNQIITPLVQEVGDLDHTARQGGFGSTNPTVITLISQQEFNQTLTTEDQVYLCILTPEGVTTTNENDPRIQTLLKEFQDVFPEELPPELPPKRDIDHRIDLEPGSRPPWRPIYRTSPLEQDAMRKELDKLLKNRSIEPSKPLMEPQSSSSRRKVEIFECALTIVP
jgi:deoxyuridine 5'-triphosphate nucleotidohydrolase